ncbi:Fap1p [Sugiyamaella lignohabitans]|uniref:Fap1p n=1 Tax=Sugiyamaella lignohabitans TaxID=796027 RepID=A0A167EJN7_9ASCO|nr:Fap1p [Sugiyamaella lignohabitans]ANB14156.1 Fap1p [Sugiyamaella lignohabitans]
MAQESNTNLPVADVLLNKGVESLSLDGQEIVSANQQLVGDESDELEYFSSSDSEFESQEEDSSPYYMDLSDILRTEIENGEYTCLICTGEIDSSSHIWSCEVCYRVYDLECIKSWCQRGIKETAGKGQAGSWKCPSCNSVKTEVIKEYRCWCSKLVNPPQDGLSPHSCGQTCNAPLTGCVHGCGSICHPGPHSECMAIGPSINCFCAKYSKQWPCIITPYQGWQCEDICNEMLPCGEHRCRQVCHNGLCGKCPELVNAKCYCGNTDESIPCSDKRASWSEVKLVDGEIKRWMGYFSCSKICDEVYDCGVHRCSKKCHTRDKDDHLCPMSPRTDEMCPCGKTLVVDLLNGRPRSSCEEPKPKCSKICQKSLSCGHQCSAECHDGECPPCRKFQSVKCACTSQAFDVPCSFVTAGNVARCRKKCTALKDCRRHRCNVICCEHEKAALERERQRKRQFRSRPGAGSTDNSPIEQVHRCDEVCNLLLNCAKHRCVMTCHNGPCHPCLESSLDDYVCPCGRTLVRAPIRCGSMIPKCKYQCTRDPECGHPRVEHECHSSEQQCPKCPYLVERLCVCEKSVIKGVQCHRQTASCGKACGNPLPGCGHPCTKVCHSQGQCLTKCTSACGKLLPCGHIHKASCHFQRESACNKSDCMEVVIDKCTCGNLTRQRKCTGQSLEEITANPSPSIGPIKCDESCAIVERNKKMAEALGLDYQAKLASSAQHKYNDDLLDLYYVDPDWSDTIEANLTEFLAMQPPTKELRLPPMNPQRRMFVHLLCEEFQLQSHSIDSGQNRSVVVLRTHNAITPAAPLRKYYHPNSIRWD